MGYNKDMKTIKRKRVTLNDKYFGDEPIIVGQPSTIQLAKALSWYNYMYNSSVAHGYVIDYMKTNPFYNKDDIQRVKNCRDGFFGVTMPSIARMATNGTEFCTDHMNLLHNMINTGIIHKLNTVVVEENKQETISIQERIDNKATLVLSDFDVVVDEVMKSRTIVDFSPYDYYRRNDISAPIARIIIKCYEPTLLELEGALGGDKELLEGYSGFTTKELKALHAIVETIINDSKRFVDNKKILRATKPKKVKSKSSVQLVDKMKYRATDEELKLVSIPPHDIINSESLWVYNTTTRMLGNYIAEYGKGLSVSGTTIQNFDPELSTGKKLRKPEESLKSILKCTKAQAKKFLATLTTTDTKLTGRINADTILLKVIK